MRYASTTLIQGPDEENNLITKGKISADVLAQLGSIYLPPLKGTSSCGMFS